MADEREWVRVEVLWDGGVEHADDDEAWDWEEGAGVLPPDYLRELDRRRADPGAGLSKRRRKKLRAERGDGR